MQHHLRLNASAAGRACAVVSVAVYLACAIAYAVAPAATIATFNALFHGIDFAKVAKPFAFGEAVVGFIAIVIAAYVLTWAWAALYNKMLGGNAGGKDDCCAQ